MYETPPIHEFAMRYPAFEAVISSRVQLALDDAAASLTQDLLSERVWRTAVMLKAAHDLVSSGLGTGVEAQLAAGGLSGFSSVSDGTVSASRAVSADSSSLQGTSYGRALSHLLRHSLPRMVVGGGDFVTPLGSPEHPVLRRE